MRSILLLLALGPLLAQTTINGSRSITGAWDASGAATTKPVKSGTSVPATCSVGEIFYKTDATAGKNFRLCTATNTWTDIRVDDGTLTLSLLAGSVTDAQVPNTITLDNISQITSRSHTSLTDIGTNSHATIDSHLSNTSNPHSTTANQVLPTQTGNSGKYITTNGTTASWANAPVTTVFSRSGTVAATAGDYTATQVTNTPGGNIAATTVQGALNELDSEKAASSHNHAATEITSGTLGTARLGSGTADNTVFLRGDSTWATPGTHTQNTDTGTSGTSFQIDNDATGPRLKNTTGSLEIRNSDDTAYVSVKASQFQTSGATSGKVELNGSTSGTVGVSVAAAAGTWNLTLPTDDGTSGQVLQTDGSGVTSWATVAGALDLSQPQNLLLVDDFIGGFTSGSSGWVSKQIFQFLTLSTGSFTTATSDESHPGIFRMTTAASNNDYALLHIPDYFHAFSHTNWVADFTVRLSSITNVLAEVSIKNADGQNLIRVFFDPNYSNTWLLQTIAGGVGGGTYINTLVAPVAGTFQTIRLTMSGAGVVNCRIGGTWSQSNANVPNTQFGKLVAQVVSHEAATKTMDIDRIMYQNPAITGR